jgi:phage terminase large subunit-like protein
MATATAFFDFCELIDFAVEPFQRKIARAAFAPERELLVLLPRGNGKTTLLAALAVHHILTTPRPAVYCAAASRDQARVLFEAAREFAAHPAIASRITLRHLEMRVAGGHLRVLASDAALLHGLTPSLSLVDELHAHHDDQVYLALRTAMLKRADARMIVSSTAGVQADSPLVRLRARALAQPSVSRIGALTSAHGGSLRLLEWAVPEDADVDDARAVKKANPASWISVAQLRDQRDALPDLAYRRYHANQMVARESAWLPPGAWQACAGDTAFEPGERIWVGVDIGGERSTSAVVFVNERLHVGVEVFTGDRSIVDVAACVDELAERYEIVECVYDPWRAASLAFEWEQRGIVAVQFPQSDARMIPASQRLYDAIIERRLVHPDDPEMNRHVHAALARHTRRGWRLERPDRATPIDSAVALCMAVERHAFQAEPVKLLGWI